MILPFAFRQHRPEAGVGPVRVSSSQKVRFEIPSVNSHERSESDRHSSDEWQTNGRTPRKSGALPYINFPAATYSPTPQGRSTIGAEGLSCRVRNGIRRFPLAKATGKKLTTVTESLIVNLQAKNKS